MRSILALGLCLSAVLILAFLGSSEAANEPDHQGSSRDSLPEPLPFQAIARLGHPQSDKETSDSSSTNHGDNARESGSRKLVHEKAVLSLAFSPNGKLLASRGMDGRVILWVVAAKKGIKEFAVRENNQARGRYTPAVRSIAFLPDSKILATGSRDSTILLWDMDSVRPLKPPVYSDADLLASFWDDLAGDTFVPWPKLIQNPPVNERDRQRQAFEAALRSQPQRHAEKAYQAIWKLAAAGDKAVAFCASAMRPVPVHDLALVRKHIAHLDDAEFTVREEATAQLMRLGSSLAPVLRRELQGKPSLEARKRMQRILEKIGEPSLSNEELQRLRFIQVLELIGTPAACNLLRKLAAGDPDAALTCEAKDALQRLERKAPKP
jgi:hypothetical protein